MLCGPESKINLIQEQLKWSSWKIDKVQLELWRQTRSTDAAVTNAIVTDTLEVSVDSRSARIRMQSPPTSFASRCDLVTVMHGDYEQPVASLVSIFVVEGRIERIIWKSSAYPQPDECWIRTSSPQVHIARCAVAIAAESLAWFDRPSICTTSHNCAQRNCYGSTFAKVQRARKTLKALHMTVLATVEDDFQLLDACVNAAVPMEEFKDASANFGLTSGSSCPTLELTRIGETPISVHANVIAKLGGVLARHVEHTPDRPIDTNSEPWMSCAFSTLKVLVGFAYLGLHKNVCDAISELDVGQPDVLYRLVAYLAEQEPSAPPTKLRELRKALAKEVRSRASALSDNDS